MFDSLKNEKKKNLDGAIQRASCALTACDVGSVEYSDTLSHLERLYTIKTETRKNRISPDTVLVVTGNLIGILVIVAYEQKHVLGSKAMNLYMKVR